MSSPPPDRSYPPSVIITLILTGGFIISCFIGGVTWIIIDRHDPTPLIGLVNLFGLGAIGSAYYFILGRMKVIEQNTNHTNDKLIDAAINSAPPAGQPDGTT